MKFLMLSIGLNEAEKNEIGLKFPEFDTWDSMVALKNIEVLRSNGCSNRTIKYVVISNPGFLAVSSDDFRDFIDYLRSHLKIKDLNELFSMNSDILSKSKDNLECFVLKAQESGKSLKEIKVMIKENLFTLD